MKAILARKILMTRIFDEDGMQIPVTLVKLENNIVTQIKNLQKDGYEAIQIGAGEKKRLNKAEAGHIKKADIKIKPKVLYEIKNKGDNYELGQALTSEQFKEEEIVNVTGVSKGKGFAGTVKRHNFHLGPKTHGSHNYRQPGSIGATYPERVIKGRRMAGHMGNARVTVKNLEIIKINQETNEMMLRGAIPGPKNTSVLIWSHNEN
ncbi:MAG: 50S ribosomal protein L3 [Patescibacteria group bacterium]|nr:50S ribosomal protein L3 [Patescibacteria group bacterium]